MSFAISKLTSSPTGRSARPWFHVGALPLGRTSILPRLCSLYCLAPGDSDHPNESPIQSVSHGIGELAMSISIFGALRSESYASDLIGEAYSRKKWVVLARRIHSQHFVSQDGLHDELATAQWVCPARGHRRGLMLESASPDSGLRPRARW